MVWPALPLFRSNSFKYAKLSSRLIDSYDGGSQFVNNMPTRSSCTTSWLLVRTAQLLIVAAMCIYVAGSLAFTMPLGMQVMTTISSWWDVPMSQEREAGHPEMVLPTYFTLVGVVPVVFTLVLGDLLRSLRARRFASRVGLCLVMFLRRKPRFCGRWISWFSYGELVFLFGFIIGGNALVFYYGFRTRYLRAKQQAEHHHTSIDLDSYLRMIAFVMGYICIFNLAFLFLPATRNSFWMEFLGISYANSIKYHRWLGVVAILTAILHCSGYYTSWLRNGQWMERALPCFDCSLDMRQGHKVWFNVFGELALLCFLLIGVTSVPWMRRKMYNTFYAVHQLFILALVFVALHWPSVIWWLLPTLAMYMASRAISKVNAVTPVEILEFSDLADGIFKIVLSRSLERSGHYEIGQFVYLNVPAISKLEWHAFTIASCPHTDESSLTILLKGLGDWTRNLLSHAADCKQKHVMPVVYMDGYYGSSLEDYEQYRTVCLIGGGIGVTPLLAILEDLIAKHPYPHRLRQKVVFVFMFREFTLLEEILPLLQKLSKLDPFGNSFRYQLYMTTSPPENFLDQPLECDRLHQHNDASSYKRMMTQTYAQPFAEPLRSRSSKTMMLLTYFVITIGILSILIYGGDKITAGGWDDLWPVQRLVEILVLFGGARLVLVYVVIDRLCCRRNCSARRSSNQDLYDCYTIHSSPTRTVPIMSPALKTRRDLLHEHNVLVGCRPDMEAVMHFVHEQHESSLDSDEDNQHTSTPVVGVFMSGPETLKTAVQQATTAIGSRQFDLHEEAFEL